MSNDTLHICINPELDSFIFSCHVDCYLLQIVVHLLCQEIVCQVSPVYLFLRTSVTVFRCQRKPGNTQVCKFINIILMYTWVTGCTPCNHLTTLDVMCSVYKSIFGTLTVGYGNITYMLYASGCAHHISLSF